MSRQELLELQNQIIEQQDKIIRQLIEEIDHYENIIISEQTEAGLEKRELLLERLQGGEM